MSWLVTTSVRFGRLVVAAALGLLVLAFVQLRAAPVGVYPELQPPTVQIQTEALGLSAAEVEQLVTVPLEQDLLNGVPWLDHITSRSQPGLSAIDLVFESGTDIYAARQMVQERLTQAHALPNVGSAPIMIQPLASSSRVAMIGLSSKDVSLVDMSVLARWKIRPKLMGVPGVANVAVYGQRDRQLQVQVDPAKLARAGVTLTDVITTAGNALWVSPLSFVEASTPGTGGFVESPNQRLAIQHLLPIRSPKDLSLVPVEHVDGTATRLRLGEVASVVQDHQPLIGDGLVNGASSLYLVVDEYPGANPLQVERDVEQAMADLGPGLSGITVDTSVYRPASYLESALHSLGLAALLGLILLFGVLVLVQSSWRATAVVTFTVLLSMTTAAYVLYLLGATLTTMTLLGLAAALVLVVDDGVRDVEAVRAALRAEKGPLARRPSTSTVVAACLHNRRGLVFGLAVALVAAVPLLVADQLTTAFTRSLVAAYALALLAATLVALVVTPTLAALVLRGTPAGLRHGLIARSALRLWDARGEAALRSPRLTWALIGVLAVGSLLAVPQLGRTSLLPTVQDRNLLVHLAAPPGTSLTEMDRVTTLVAQELSDVHGVGDVGGHVGRAITSEQQVDVNEAELWLTVEDEADYAATTRAIDRIVHGYPGINGSLVTYTGDRVVAASDPDRDKLVVRVYGFDLPTLQRLAGDVQKKVAKVAGVVSPTVEHVPTQPAVHVEVDLTAAARYGLAPGDIRRDATTLTSGLIVGSLYEDAKIFDVVVWGGAAARQDLTDLRNLRIDTPRGTQVRLGDVAHVTVAPEPVAISHHDVSRSVDVVAGIQGRSASAVVDEVRAELGTMAKWPLEYHAEVLGGSVSAQSDVVRTLAYGVGAVLIVLLLVQAATRSWRSAGLLVALVPLSLAGGVLAAAAVGGVRALGPLAALFAVGTLTARHGVMLLRAVSPPDVVDLRDDPPDPLDAVRGEVVPVLATALACAAFVLPAAFNGARAGLESVQPFAVTLLGGLVSSTVVVLLVLPAFLRLGKATRREASASATTETAPAEGTAS